MGPTLEKEAAYFRSGFVVLFGRPNTGKTTLLNRLCGEKLGIVSPKPQTTRNRILGVRTGKRTQLIFLDTPGVIVGPRKLKFDERVQQTALDSLKESEVALLMIDASRAWGQEDVEATSTALASRHPVLCAANKIDLVPRERRASILKRIAASTGIDDIIPISAAEGHGIAPLLRRICRILPLGPRYYPDDTLTDQSSRFLAAELIREQLFLQTDEEVPYGCAVQVDSYKETDDEIRIAADIIVERESLKGMIIGAKGAKIKALGAAARMEIAKLTGKTVHLNLFVKLYKNWRKDEKAIKGFGY